MAFDFNPRPLRIYGLWPEAPFPLKVSIYGLCRMSCSFCFANLNRAASDRDPHLVNSTPALLRQLDRVVEDEHSPFGHFLRERYPVVFSNTTDPFQRDEKQYRASEAFLAWCKAHQVPVSVQTRGNVLLEDWERYAPLLEPGRCVVYLSVCQTDDGLRRRHEPGAMSLGRRWELARRLSDHGVPVIAACNPYVPEWVPSPDAYCDLALAAGCRGVVVDRLHLTPKQACEVPETYETDLIPLANLHPGYLLPRLKDWKRACAERGLVLDCTPQWNHRLGLSQRHVECADPAWLGGRVFDLSHRVLNALARLAEEVGGPVLIGWPEVRDALDVLGVADPLLDVSPFWHAYNSSVSADHARWRAGLGDRAHLSQVLRYWWNSPWESSGMLWHHECMRPVWFPADRTLARDEDGDCLGLYDPTRRPGDPKDVDHDLAAGAPFVRFKE